MTISSGVNASILINPSFKDVRVGFPWSNDSTLTTYVDWVSSAIDFKLPKVKDMYENRYCYFRNYLNVWNYKCTCTWFDKNY